MKKTLLEAVENKDTNVILDMTFRNPDFVYTEISNMLETKQIDSAFLPILSEIGQKLEDGFHCTPDLDIKESVRWYTLAANHGHSFSQYCLGYWYENGAPDLAIERNVEKAIGWYRLAADQKEGGAIRALEKFDIDQALYQLRSLEIKIIPPLPNEKDEVKKPNSLSHVISALKVAGDKKEIRIDSWLELILNLIQLNHFNQARDLYGFWTTRSSKNNMPCYFFNEIIHAFGKKNRLDSALDIYYQAIQFQKFNTLTFNYALDAAIRKSDFQTADIIYDLAISSGHAAVTTHITAMRFKSDIKLGPTPEKILSSETKLTDIKDLSEVFKPIGLNDQLIKEMLALCGQKGIFTGKFATLIGALLYSKLNLDLIKLILIKDFDCALPCHSISNKVDELKKQGYDERKREIKEQSTWTNMIKRMDDGQLIDLSVIDEIKYKQVTPPFVVAGKVSVFSEKTLPPAHLDDYDILTYKNVYFAIHKKDENFPLFKFHCQNLSECWLLADLDPSSLKVALKSYLFVDEFRKKNNPAVNQSMPDSPSRELITYPELLANLPEYFHRQILAHNLNALFRGLYNLLEYLDFSGSYAEIHLRAIIQAYILFHVRYCNKKQPDLYLLDQMTTFAYDGLTSLFIQNRPSKAPNLMNVIEDAVSKSLVRPDYIKESPSFVKPITSYPETLDEKNISEQDPDFYTSSHTINYSDDHPLIKLQKTNLDISSDWEQIYLTPEYTQLAYLNEQVVNLHRYAGNKPLTAERFSKIFNKNFLYSDQFIAEAELALLALNNRDIYLDLNKICLKCLKDCTDDKELKTEIDPLIQDLKKMGKSIEDAKKDHNQKSQIGLKIYTAIILFKEKMPKEIPRLEWLELIVLPWIKIDINESKKKIVHLVEKLFHQSYLTFLYFEREMLIQSVPDHLEAYMKFQNNLLNILMKYINFLEKQGVVNFNSMMIYSNFDEAYRKIDLENAIRTKNSLVKKNLLSLIAVKAKISAAQLRVNSIKNKGPQLQKTVELLTEIENLQYHLSVFDKSSVMTAMRASNMWKISNLIDTALSSNNELFFWVLQELKFNIEFHNLVLNMKNPVIILDGIAHIINSFSSLIVSPAWNELSALSLKKEEAYFNDFNTLSPLLGYAIQIQKLLYYMLWVSKKIEHPDLYIVNRMLNNISAMLTFQSQILYKRKNLDLLYGMHLNNWLFMDEKLRIFPHCSKGVQETLPLNIADIINNNSAIIKKFEKLKALLTQNRPPLKIFENLQNFILARLADSKKAFKGEFLPSQSLDDWFEDIGELKENQQLMVTEEEKIEIFAQRAIKASDDIKELEISLQADIKAIDDNYKKSLEQMKNLIRQTEKQEGDIYDELKNEEKNIKKNVVSHSTKNKRKKTKKFKKDPATSSYSTKNLPRANFVKPPPMIVIHEFFPEGIQKECRNMAVLHISIRELIDQNLSNNPLEKISKKMTQFNPYRNSNNPQLRIRAIWHETDIYAYVALQFIKWAILSLLSNPLAASHCFYVARKALDQSNQSYSELLPLIKKNPELTTLLELTLQNLKERKDSYEHAKNILNNKINREKDQVEDIIARKGIDWWGQQRQYELYLLCDIQQYKGGIKGNAFILTDDNTVYFIIKGKIQLQTAENINRGKIQLRQSIKPQSIQPIIYSASREEKMKVVKQSIAKQPEYIELVSKRTQCRWSMEDCLSFIESSISMGQEIEGTSFNSPLKLNDSAAFPVLEAKTRLNIPYNQTVWPTKTAVTPPSKPSLNLSQN